MASSYARSQQPFVKRLLRARFDSLRSLVFYERLAMSEEALALRLAVSLRLAHGFCGLP